jgi:hypothetical protein
LKKTILCYEDDDKRLGFACTFLLLLCVGIRAMHVGVCLGLFCYHSVSKKIKSFLGTCVEFSLASPLLLSLSLSLCCCCYFFKEEGEEEEEEEEEE